MRALVVALSLGCATALSIKTSPASKPEGHFYNADGCEDCVYKGEKCGCQPAVEYFACLTKHCHPANHTSFAEKCMVIGNKCESDLDIDCRGPETVCRSKWSQLPTGGMGFSVNINKDKAFCGPFGKCLGKIIMDVQIHREEPEAPPAPKVPPAAPAPALPSSPAAAPAPSLPVVAVPAPPVWLECGLPVKAKADIDNKEDWRLCQKEVKGDTASCKMQLFKELEAGGAKESYCVLTDGKDGKRLTSPYWSAIMNVHEAAKEAEAAKETEAAPKAEKKEPEKKAEKPKKEEKPEEAHLENDDSSKLPWMVDKEKRQAARAAEAAEEQEEKEKAKAVEKAEKKEAKEKAAKEAPKGSDKDKLPWMKGKENEKPPPPPVVPA